MSEGLAQGPHVADGVGFEPATLRKQGAELPLDVQHHAFMISPTSLSRNTKHRNIKTDINCLENYVELFLVFYTSSLFLEM